MNLPEGFVLDDGGGAPDQPAPSGDQLRLTVRPQGSERPALDGRARDLAIRTIYGEAAQEPDEGKAAVAAVIRNRAQAGRYGGSDVPSVVMARNQFEPWNRADARARMLALRPGSPEYEAIGQIVDGVFTGQTPDPTNGATHFFAPQAQAALGRDVPSWGRSGGQPIGRHTFFAPEGRVGATEASAQVRKPAPVPGALPAGFVMDEVPAGFQVTPTVEERSAVTEAAPQNPAALQAALEKRAAGLAPQQPPGMLAKAIEPITSYPSTYGQMNRESRQMMSEGVEQAGQGTFKDAAIGAGKVALGGLSYVTSPINAAIRTVVGKPVEENTGVPKELTEFATSMALPIPKRLPIPAKAAERAAPATAEIKGAATKAYDDITAAGNAKPVPPEMFTEAATGIKKSLDDAGLRASVAPKTHAAMDEVSTAMGNPMPDLTELVAAKRALKEIAGGIDKTERKAATAALRQLDAKIAEISPDVANSLKIADGNYAAAMQAGRVEGAIAKGHTRAEKSGVGGNLDNTIRQEVDKVRAKPGLTADEAAQAEKVVAGTRWRNTLRTIGRLDPTSGGVAALGHMAAAVPSGGANLPLAAVGYAARKMAERLTERDAQRLVKMIQSRSPHAQRVTGPMKEWGEAAAALESTPNVQNLVRLQLVSNNLATNLKDFGVNIAPADLLRSLQGPVKSAAEDEQQ